METRRAEIGTPGPSFVPHSRLLLTLKCAAHLTLGGETGVSPLASAASF